MSPPTKTRPTKLAICVNKRFSDKPSCASRGSVEIADAIEAGLAERNIAIPLERIICFGMCSQGPSMRLIPKGEFFKQVKLADVPGILDELEREI